VDRVDLRSLKNFISGASADCISSAMRPSYHCVRAGYGYRPIIALAEHTAMMRHFWKYVDHVNDLGAPIGMARRFTASLGRAQHP
jgi:hypothetical protein